MLSCPEGRSVYSQELIGKDDPSVFVDIFLSELTVIDLARTCGKRICLVIYLLRTQTRHLPLPMQQTEVSS